MERIIAEDIKRKRLLRYGHLRRMKDNRCAQNIWSWSPTERRRKRRRPYKRSRRPFGLL